MCQDKSQVIMLHLDESVTAFRYIFQETSSKQTVKLAEVQSMVAEKVQSQVKSSHSKGRSFADAPPLATSGSRGSSDGRKKRKKPL